MNAKVILIKGRAERTLELRDTILYSCTIYKTSFDAEGVYVRTKTWLKKQGWRAKPAIISIIENAPRRKKIPKFLGRFVGGNGTVGE